ncbi:MAG TPA: hypothetical protein V6D48_24210 [Oculatellaceae cyanobacterium]
MNGSHLSKVWRGLVPRDPYRSPEGFGAVGHENKLIAPLPSSFCLLRSKAIAQLNQPGCTAS